MLIEEAKPSSGLQLIFKKPPSFPIFTENRIEDEDGFPLEILLVDTATGKKPISTFPSSFKAELVVLDGDFPYESSSDNWSSADFNRHIVKERKGRRPLLAGDVVLTLKDGSASTNELKFTDNSSWIRSRNFRIGVRVSSALGDEVWRLEKIGKDGVFHKKLMVENINTVQDFLKLSVIDSTKLRKILGMSDRNWEATINHARTCPLGDKLYIHRGPHYAIVLSPICEVVSIEVDGVSWTFQELRTPARATVQELVLEAYKFWDSLEEISIPLQGETVNQVETATPYQIEGVYEGGLIQYDVQMELYNCLPEL